jgi:hypothetical protein|nr:hypothetical protein [uncultured Neisseria sp.]
MRGNGSRKPPDAAVSTQGLNQNPLSLCRDLVGAHTQPDMKKTHRIVDGAFFISAFKAGF